MKWLILEASCSSLLVNSLVWGLDIEYPIFFLLLCKLFYFLVENLLFSYLFCPLICLYPVLTSSSLEHRTCYRPFVSVWVITFHWVETSQPISPSNSIQFSIEHCNTHRAASRCHRCNKVPLLCFRIKTTMRNNSIRKGKIKNKPIIIIVNEGLDKICVIENQVPTVGSQSSLVTLSNFPER